jgi:hypothetical protein
VAGFERNEQMRVKYQRAPITADWTVGTAANTGDGIVAAEKLGAALELMEDAWWARRFRCRTDRGSRCLNAMPRARSWSTRQVSAT